MVVEATRNSAEIPQVEGKTEEWEEVMNAASESIRDALVEAGVAVVDGEVAWCEGKILAGNQDEYAAKRKSGLDPAAALAELYPELSREPRPEAPGGWMLA